MKIELYQPCNGTELDIFSGYFCDNCLKMPVSCEAKNQCGILRDVLCFDPGDKEYPNQWRYVDGKPVCTAFVDREEANKERCKKLRTHPCKDKKTLELF